MLASSRETQESADQFIALQNLCFESSRTERHDLDRLSHSVGVGTKIGKTVPHSFRDLKAEISGKIRGA